MGDNQRESFRIEEPFEAELFHQGRIVPCRVLNLSAGGARVESAVEMNPGSQCTLGLVLDADLRASTGLTYVSYLMEVLESTALRGGELAYRLRNASGEAGSKTYEEANRLVFAAHRRALARASGADEASGMASDADRRRKLRPPRFVRFGKGSTRPDHRGD